MTDQNLIDSYREQFGARLAVTPFLAEMRAAAFDAFADTGMPSARSEAFRYADLKALRDRPFNWVADAQDFSEVHGIIDEFAARVVFSDGAYCEHTSVTDNQPEKLVIRRLGNHFAVSEARASELETPDDSLGQLNTAMLTDGVVISVPAGVTIAHPVKIIHRMTPQGGSDVAAHPRIVVELGEGAKLELIERFIGASDSQWVNAVTQVRLAEQASLIHSRLVEPDYAGLVTSATHIRAGAESQYQGLTAAIGGRSTRMSVLAHILSEGADINSDGVALADAGQTHDAHFHVRHMEAGATSDQVFRTVAAKRGTSSFTGKVTVAKDAQQTEADQSFKALLLDRTASANAKPELEILADDVKCSHGATVGELDDKALFYMMSRGLTKAEATHMLVEAFLGDALLRFEGTPVGEFVQQATADWMAAHKDDLTS